MAKSGWKESGTAMYRWLVDHKATASALAIATGFLCVRVWAQQQPAVFKSDVKLVHVIASVKNAKGELVGKLQKSDFRIWDNGAEQEVKVFEPQSATPLSVALMID